MNVRLLLCCLVCAPVVADCAEAQSKRPNVILVITDDQGYGDLGCHGNKIIKTPNLDKLYTQSIRFTNFHVDPTCSPTRSALMTGRYSGRVGVWHTIMGRSLLHSDELTMAEIFKASGYRTAMFGKWHLGDNFPMRPQDQGFDEVFCHGGGGVGQTPDYWGNDYFDDTYWHNGVPKKNKGYCTDVWFDAAQKFITKNKDRPFFVYLPTNAPHGPYLVAEKYRKLYSGIDGVPKKKTAPFWGMITNIDENMGRLTALLEKLNLDDNTILIFMTDNGSAAGWRVFNAGMRGGKGSQYDGGHRVPCFVRWPAGNLGDPRDVPQLTAHLDMSPTLIDLCKLKSPKNHKFDGKSLAPLLRNRDAEWKDRAIVVESQRIETPQMWRKCAVMTQQWRLIDGKALYDIHKDPGQKTDMAADHPKLVKRLRDIYVTWWKDVSRSHNRYARIGLGSSKEPVARLTGHDWHEGNPPWHQNHIRRGAKANGFWAVETMQAGTYEIELRRWPVVEPKGINQGPGLRAVSAKIRIFGKEHTMNVGPDAKKVTFRVPLQAGATRLQTWLTNAKRQSRGAYFAYVRRVEGKE